MCEVFVRRISGWLPTVHAEDEHGLGDNQLISLLGERAREFCSLISFTPRERHTSTEAPPGVCLLCVSQAPLRTRFVWQIVLSFCRPRSRRTEATCVTSSDWRAPRRATESHRARAPVSVCACVCVCPMIDIAAPDHDLRIRTDRRWMRAAGEGGHRQAVFDATFVPAGSGRNSGGAFRRIARKLRADSRSHERGSNQNWVRLHARLKCLQLSVDGED